jgi:hypothetical protein
MLVGLVAEVAQSQLLSLLGELESNFWKRGLTGAARGLGGHAGEFGVVVGSERVQGKQGRVVRTVVEVDQLQSTPKSYGEVRLAEFSIGLHHQQVNGQQFGVVRWTNFQGFSAFLDAADEVGFVVMV